MNLEKTKYTLKKWNSIFCAGMACKTNIGRDIAVVLVAVIAAGAFLYANIGLPAKEVGSESKSLMIAAEVPGIVAGEKDSNPVLTEEDISSQTENLIRTVDTNAWKKFDNQFWGFTVKYPGDWLSPKAQNKSAGAKWESRYQFRRKDAGENPYLGFDVAVYDVPKTKELKNTEEYPSIKSAGLETDERCQNIEGHAVDVDDFPAEEIYIPPADDCYGPALFFSIVKERYIYNIVPVFAEGPKGNEDPRISINGDFPEFYAAAATLGMIDIVRPKPAPPKPRITAPKPVSFKVVGGKLVCAKKNDKPRKSRQNKGKHLDMECCLDPDETPNPWCTY